MRALSVENVASIIGVSDATIRNWVKAGHIKPLNNRPLSFLEKDALDLKTAINSGLLSRLRTRANKSLSETISIPKEYANNAALLEVVESILDVYRRNKLELTATIYFAALRFLELRNEVRRTLSGNIRNLSSFHSWNRQSVKSEMISWQAIIQQDDLPDAYDDIYFSIKRIEEEDFLGLLYQSLRNEGDKSNKGSYYTPSHVVKESFTKSELSGETFLDPCCGTGKYLLYAAKYLNLSPSGIYGFDNDELATRIARLNLLQAYNSLDFTPNISCLNTITELATGDLYCKTNDLLGRIDFVATNPPWGAYKNLQFSERFSNGIRSNEAFSLFLAKSLTFLKDGGRLSFILPESILKIRTHSDIRKILLANTKLISITKLGRQFTGVFTNAIRIDLVKGKAPSDWRVSIEENGKTFEVLQSRFSDNQDAAFDVEVNEDEDRIFKSIYGVGHLTLAGNADWALGIVTGNNSKYVAEVADSKMEPVLKGRDILQFGLREPQAFIKFAPSEFQQVAKESLYRAPEKLVYKFISSSLAFAYDNKQMLTLNSANILIPRLPGISIKVALAFLNSKVFQYVFSKRFSTHKVLRGDLEKLPFPILSQEMYAKIESLVDAIHAGNDRRKELQSLIFSAFHLSETDIRTILHNDKES